jgi:hypothetical protein
MVKTPKATTRGTGGVAHSNTKKVKNVTGMVKTPKAKASGTDVVAHSKTKKVNNVSAVCVSPEKWDKILRKKQNARTNSGSLTEADPFNDYIQREIAKKKLEGRSFNDQQYRGMLVPMLFEIVSKCISCVLLVPLDPRMKTAESRAFLQPATVKLFSGGFFATVTVQGNNSKVDCDGELIHKVVEMLPSEGKAKQVGKATKYNSYIFGFAVNHSNMEKEVSDEYIVSIARRFGQMLSENLDDDKSPDAKKRIFAADEVYEMKSIRLCQMIKADDVFRILDDVVSFSEDGKGRMYDFQELLAIPEMKEVLTGAFGEGNVDDKEMFYANVAKRTNVDEVHQYYG